MKLTFVQARLLFIFFLFKAWGPKCRTVKLSPISCSHNLEVAELDHFSEREKWERSSHARPPSLNLISSHNLLCSRLIYPSFTLHICSSSRASLSKSRIVNKKKAGGWWCREVRWERRPQQTLSHILAINTNNFIASVEAVQIQQLRLVHGRLKKKQNTTTPKQEDICVHFKAAVTHRGENGRAKHPSVLLKIADFSD